MMIRFVKSHGVYKRGQVIDHQYQGVVTELIRRGIAERVEPEQKAQRAKRK